MWREGERGGQERWNNPPPGLFPVVTGSVLPPVVTYYQLCRRHTVPKWTADGHTIKEMFNFGGDHKDIGPFIS